MFTKLETFITVFVTTFLTLVTVNLGSGSYTPQNSTSALAAITPSAEKCDPPVPTQLSRH